MLHLPLSPEDEVRLRKRASAVGKDIAEYVLQVVEEDLAMTEPTPPPESRRQEEWEKELDAWAAGHPHAESTADDSRESIYAGRGE